MKKPQLIKTGKDAGLYQFGHQIGTREIQNFLNEFNNRKISITHALNRVYKQLPKQASHKNNLSMRQAFAAAA